MPEWILRIVEVVPFAAWAACGLLSLLLQPGNPAARRLAAVGGLFAVSRLLDYLLVDHPVASGQLASSWLARWLDDTTFLLGLAALVAALAVFPDGRYETRWERIVSLGLPVVAVIASLSRLIGSPSMSFGGDPQTAVPNEAFVPGLRLLGSLGNGLAATEPAWVLIGLAILVMRFRRAHGPRRSELLWPLAAVGALAGTLVAVIAVHAAYAAREAALEAPIVTVIFLLVLTLFPASLLVGIAARVRHIHDELALSRSRVVRAESDARRQLERDLHDGVQQQLVGLLSLVQVASRQVGRRDHRAGMETLTQATAQTRQAITGLRDLVGGIHPPVLTDRGLVAALADQFPRPGLPVRLETEPGLGRWSADVEAAAYFVVCEALTNAVKHARAEEVVVSIDAPDGALRVRVRDTGTGFDPNTAQLRGLQGARDRVEGLGGRFRVVSAPASGTLVEVVLPAETRP